MKITIHGSGYVGLVTGACLAEVGHDVLLMDVDEGKINALRKGEIPIYEPGLDQIFAEARQLGRVDFTTDIDRAVAHAPVHFIAVGTPPDEDGSADLTHVMTVAENIARRMKERTLIINKSTVPVGTGDLVERRVREVLAERGVDVPFAVVSNPEFLKEGAAIEDFRKPDRVVVGSEDDWATEIMREIYRPFSKNYEKLMVMGRRTAELVKYASNAFLATKISFMNELAAIAEKVGADIELVRLGMGADRRIGYHFIYPGCGYGGSCFPKDVKALIHMAREKGVEPRILEAVEARNEIQKRLLFDRVRERFGDDLSGRVFAIWGLSFKPETDDMREAPSRVIMENLWKAGAVTRVHDPVAMNECRRIYGEHDRIVYCSSPEEAVDGADALIVVTEWTLYRSPDFKALKERMRCPVIFDGRNIYDPPQVRALGYEYHAIGRP